MKLMYICLYMRQSQLLTKTRKEGPKDEVSKNANLLIRAGFINKEMAGVYDYLPLGLRTLKKIENIIREEMNMIGGQEVLMTTLQDPELWKKSGRWDDSVVDNWFKTKLATGTELGIANTHEEPITEMLTHFVSSYKDLPIYVYQFQTKFRNELRAKSGIMRCREFLMKDMYSFSRTEEEFKKFYEECAEAYTKIFKRVGLGEHTFRTIAAGGSFTSGFTDEFQTISSSGEDIIYIDRAKGLAINKEVYTPENMAQFGLDTINIEEQKSIEVGNIFPLGTKYPDAIGLKIKDETGESKTIFMGSYGIGLGRVLGTIAEIFSDENGLVWPVAVAPFKVHLIEIKSENIKVQETAEALYKKFMSLNIEVLHDDRDARAGEKFGDSDLMGMPLRIVVSEKGIEKGEFEVKERKNGTVSIFTENELVKFVTEYK